LPVGCRTSVGSYRNYGLPCEVRSSREGKCECKGMKKSALPKQLQLSKTRLDDLVDEALTDAYGE